MQNPRFRVVLLLALLGLFSAPIPADPVPWRRVHPLLIPDGNCTSVVEFNNELWRIGDNNQIKGSEPIFSSRDGIHWQVRVKYPPFGGRYRHGLIVFNGRIWVIAGERDIADNFQNDAWASSDGVHWDCVATELPFSPRGRFACAVFGDKIYVIGGVTRVSGAPTDSSTDEVWTSPDGIEWSLEYKLPLTLSLLNRLAFVFKNKLFLVNILTSEILYTPDGRNWRSGALPPGLQVPTFTIYNNRLWTTGGMRVEPQKPSFPVKEVWSTSDGQTWDLETPSAEFPEREHHGCVAWNGKLVLFGGIRIGPFHDDLPDILEDAWSSTDGKTWTNEAPPYTKRTKHCALAYHQKMWIIGGLGKGGSRLNDVWQSADGEKWTTVTANAPFTPRASHAAVVFKDRMWIIGGRDSGGARNDVWSSADGLAWTQPPGSIPFPPRYGHSCVEFGGKLWLIGGQNSGTGNLGDVWSSADGETWNLETDSPDFAPRCDHLSAAFKGKLWVLGGTVRVENKDQKTTEVWNSGDGRTWIKSEAGLPYSTYGAVCAVPHENLWILGNAFYGGGWSSPDGITWTAAPFSNPFGARFFPACTFFKGTVWVLGGGSLYDSASFQDVWCSPLDGLTAVTSPWWSYH